MSPPPSARPQDRQELHGEAGGAGSGAGSGGVRVPGSAVRPRRRQERHRRRWRRPGTAPCAPGRSVRAPSRVRPLLSLTGAVPDPEQPRRPCMRGESRALSPAGAAAREQRRNRPRAVPTWAGHGRSCPGPVPGWSRSRSGQEGWPRAPGPQKLHQTGGISKILPRSPGVLVRKVLERVWSVC